MESVKNFLLQIKECFDWNVQDDSFEFLIRYPDNGWEM